jgi:putative ABC transport system substrate-binding protein
MRRRAFILGFGCAAASAGLRHAAAQSTRTYRIGVMETISPEANRANLEGLRRGLRELGYIEGQNLKLEYRSSEGQAARFPDIAAEFVRMNVDLIVTRGTPAAIAARDASSKIPIVMAAIGEPLNVGIVSSLARPGGNITGMSSFVTELAGKRVELLKETFPSTSRVGFVQNHGNPVSAAQWEVTQTAAGALGLTAELFDVRTQPDIAAAFVAIKERKVDALSIGIDGLIQAHASMIASLANQLRLPTAYPAREFVEAGGLLSYGTSYPDLYFRSAGFIDKIFKGARPGDLPVEQPTKLELVINLKTARALGFAFPPTFLARADEVIE